MTPRLALPKLADFAAALPRLLRTIRCSLITKLAIASGAALMLFFFLWSSLNINAMKTLATEAAMSDMDRLGNTINLGLHYAMLTYAPDTIREIIKSISTQQGIISIRVYNKKGQIKYSNLLSEIDDTTDIKEEACYVCHRTSPPQVHIPRRERTRFFTDDSGHPCIGILGPSKTNPRASAIPATSIQPTRRSWGCSTSPCPRPAARPCWPATPSAISWPPWARPPAPSWCCFCAPTCWSTARCGP